MNSKERVEILLNKEISDRMGLFEHFWGQCRGHLEDWRYRNTERKTEKSKGKGKIFNFWGPFCI